jgi:hypothetical protein
MTVRLFCSCQNPASFAGPRGIITLSQNKPFPIGVVNREGGFLLPFFLCNTSFKF